MTKLLLLPATAFFLVWFIVVFSVLGPVVEALSIATLAFTDAAIQQVLPAPGGLDVIAEAQGAVATFRCYAARTNFQLCQALHPNMVVDLVGQPVPSDADDANLAELLELRVHFLVPQPPPGDSDGNGR